MRTFWVELLSLVSGVAFAAEEPVFRASFPSFSAPSAQVEWAAPTNNQRNYLWVYKVVPKAFPERAVSNLMAMASLTMSDQLPGALLFNLTTKDYSRYLTINTNQGRLEYHNEEALARMSGKKTHRPEPAEAVPTDAEVEALALKLLQQFGIQRSDLAAKAGTSGPLTFGHTQTRGYLDKTRGVYVDNEVTMRGIFFNRRIDGINFAGIGIGGGCEVDFGNHAEVADLKLVWRYLQPYEHRKVASPDEISRRIQEGQAVMTHRNVVNPAQVRKLTITDISPLYMGAPGDERQDFVYPFAQLEAVADLGSTNSSLQLYCPILSDK